MRVNWVCPICCWSISVINEHVYYVSHRCKPNIPRTHHKLVTEDEAIKKNYCELGERTSP